MVRVFRSAEQSDPGEDSWSFAYVDWQGKARVGIGTESRQETKKLADRVQAEHDLLRTKRRHSLDNHNTVAPQPVVAGLPGVVQDATPSSAPTLQVFFGDAFAAAARPAGTPQSPRIGERMIGAGLISGDDLTNALAYQDQHGGKLVEVLIAQQIVSPDEYLLFMGKLPGTPRIELGNCLHIPDAVLQLIPAQMAEALEVIPVDRIGKMLSVAMICPLDRKAIDRLQEHTGLKIRPMLCSHAEFRIAMNRHYGRSSQETRKRTAS